jgi:hypothetical protein
MPPSNHTFIKRLRRKRRAWRSEERTPSSLVTTKEIKGKKNFRGESQSKVESERAESRMKW